MIRSAAGQAIMKYVLAERKICVILLRDANALDRSVAAMPTITTANSNAACDAKWRLNLLIALRTCPRGFVRGALDSDR